MTFKPRFLIVLCIFTAACVSSGSHSSDRYQNRGLEWRDFGQISSQQTSLVDTSEGQRLYGVYEVPPIPEVTLSNGRVVTGGKDECLKLISSGNALFIECDNAFREANRKARRFSSKEQLISAAKRIIRADGRCTWLGYDPVLDNRVRVGSFFQNNDSLFFTLLACE